MDSKQIAIVQESFETIRHNMPRISRVFYDRLFELDSGLKPLFSRDIREQRKKFAKALTYIVQNLRNHGLVVPKISELGKRHVRYGVRPQHYDTFNEALIFALSAALGSQFTPDTKTAWKNTFRTLSDIMIQFSYQLEELEQL